MIEKIMGIIITLFVAIFMITIGLDLISEPNTTKNIAGFLVVLLTIYSGIKLINR